MPRGLGCNRPNGLEGMLKGHGRLVLHRRRFPEPGRRDRFTRARQICAWSGLSPIFGDCGRRGGDGSMPSGPVWKKDSQRRGQPAFLVYTIRHAGFAPGIFRQIKVLAGQGRIPMKAGAARPCDNASGTAVAGSAVGSCAGDKVRALILDEDAGAHKCGCRRRRFWGAR